MKSSKPTVPPNPRPAAGPRPWLYLVAACATLLALLEAYQPALNGPFLFDDLYLPFQLPDFIQAPLVHWLRQSRPLLMLTFWLNLRGFGLDPYFFHLFNVLCHFANAVLVYLIVGRLLRRVGVEGWNVVLHAGFAAGVFLFHPLQTESVAYVASRSEALSVLFFYTAFTVFLYRRETAASWSVAAVVLGFFAAAALTKEHTAVLPALLLLTDYFWNPGFSFGGIKRNWRLYSALMAAGATGLVFVWRVLRASDTAGFAVAGLPWHDYLYTQGRAIWVYLRMFLLPIGLNLDHQFAISRSPLDHGAVLGLAVLAALAAVAVALRRKYPLSCYGILVFLLLIAPTSSFIPIKDPLVERRMYLPMIGLVLVIADVTRRFALRRSTLAWMAAGILLVAGAATRARNQVWSSAIQLWEDSVEKAPRKYRPHFQLAYAYFQAGRCPEAAKQYELASRFTTMDYSLLIDWALACDCAQQPDLAVEKLRQAINLERTAHAHALLGMVYAKRARRAEAEAALDEAERINPRFVKTYVYRGNLQVTIGQYAAAADSYRRALALNPNDSDARAGLDVARRNLKVAY
jgi:protein O-mannosyl-transferase